MEQNPNNDKNLIPPSAATHTANTTPNPNVSIPAEVKLTIEVPKEELPLEAKLSFFELAQAIVAKTWFIILIGFVFFSVAFGFAYWREHNSQPHSGVASTLFVYGFPNAELGLDPLGNALNVHAIRSPHIIGQALDSLGFRERGIFAEDIRANLTTTAVHANEPLAQIRRLYDMMNPGERLMELIDEVSYHPTQFVLSLYRTGALSQLTSEEMSLFLTTLVAYYTEDFIASYNELTFLSTVASHIGPRDYDFFELVEILNIAMSNMSGHLTLLEYLYPDFRSRNTSQTFAEILANLEIMRRIDLGGLNSEISRNSLSRDRGRAADILEHRVMLLQLEEQTLRLNAEHAILVATELYDQQSWVFGYHDTIHEFFRLDSVYNDMLRRAQYNIEEANWIAADIIQYQRSIENFRHGTPPSAAVVAQIENSIDLLFDDLARLEGITNQTIEDLIVYDLFSDAIRTLAPPVFNAHSGVNTTFVLLIALIGGLVGVFIGTLVVIYRHAFL